MQFDSGMLNFLLVDDDPIVLTVAEYVIRSLGKHSVQTAEDGQAALEILNRSLRRIDVIILDLNMPRMDGIAFIRAASKLGFEGQVIISSGEIEAIRSAAARICAMVGVDIAGVLAKPIRTEALAKVLADMKGSKGRRSPAAHSSPSRSGLVIMPFYQPQYRIDTGALVGLEALARAFDTSGKIYGAQIALGDMTDPANVRETTLTIHRKVMDDMRMWEQAGLDCNISINLESGLLSDAGFCGQLADLCADSDVSPRNVVYEMTERQMPEDLSLIIENVARLRMAGFGVALDDFGTGAANFDILRSCPFSELKLDRSIVASCLAETQAQQFIDFTVRAADEQGLRLVAEGVETLEELDFVKSAGVNVVQGYLLDKPLSCVDATARLRTGPSELIANQSSN